MSESARSLQPPARESCLFLLPFNGSLALTLADAILSDDFGRRTDSMELFVPAGILALLAVYMLGRSHGRLDEVQRHGRGMELTGEPEQLVEGDGRGWRICQAVLMLTTFALLGLLLTARFSTVL